MTEHRQYDRRDVLRQVVRAADARRDGELPLDVPGAREIFTDPVTLLSVLQLKWYAALVAAVEKELASAPASASDSPEDAVVAGWRSAAEQLPGVRLVLDRALRDVADPDDPLRRALAKEHQMLAVMAGVAPQTPGLDPAVVAAGHELEQAARTAPDAAPGKVRRLGLPYSGLLCRLRAVVAA